MWCVRLWDLRGGREGASHCTANLLAHLAKGGEGANAAAYAKAGALASGQPLLATAGADGAVRLVAAGRKRRESISLEREPMGSLRGGDDEREKRSPADNNDTRLGRRE
eukprot:1176323-Prorocentrum_minimum.AAC.6